MRRAFYLATAFVLLTAAIPAYADSSRDWERMGVRAIPVQEGDGKKQGGKPSKEQVKQDLKSIGPGIKKSFKQVGKGAKDGFNKAKEDAKDPKKRLVKRPPASPGA